jgi:hypothetical protein
MSFGRFGIIVVSAVGLFGFWLTGSHTGQTVAAPPGLNDQEIAAAIVQESRQAYYATGHPCACPEDLARNGSRCGGRSAYSRPGGASPKCYASDVTPGEIADYRKAH